MNALYSIALLALTTTLALADLGDSREQETARYGQPAAESAGVDGTMVTYSFGQQSIIACFNGGTCVGETLVRAPYTLTAAEVGKFMTAAGKRKSWELVSDPNPDGNKTWRLEDGTLECNWQPKQNAVAIIRPNRSARFTPLALPASNPAGFMHVKEGYLASDDPAVLRKAISLVRDNDLAALQKLIDTKTVAPLKAGLLVKKLDDDDLPGLVKIRPKGEIIELWTVADALEN